MVNLAPTQLLRLWSELEMALHCTNPYGRNMAEIYAYTLMPRVPRVEAYERSLKDQVAYRAAADTALLRNEVAPIYAAAARTLATVCEMFEEMRDAKVRIEYNDGESESIWVHADVWARSMAVIPCGFIHRAHVRVTGREVSR